MRFHVHTHVEDLNASIALDSKILGAQPVRPQSDYAKWHLENPRSNFAISTRCSKTGIDHLGFLVDTAEELVELKVSAKTADRAVLDEGTTSYYAKRDKHWVTDHKGIAWEHVQTLGAIPVFSESQNAKPSPAASVAAGCCPRCGKPGDIPVKAGSFCC